MLGCVVFFEPLLAACPSVRQMCAHTTACSTRTRTSTTDPHSQQVAVMSLRRVP